MDHDSLTDHVVAWNVSDTPLLDDYAQQEAPYCPVNADPFLPWIHDFFPLTRWAIDWFIAQTNASVILDVTFHRKSIN